MQHSNFKKNTRNDQLELGWHQVQALNLMQQRKNRSNTMIITFGHAHIIPTRKTLVYVHCALAETFKLCIFQVLIK
jgi:hypothetical protein